MTKSVLILTGALTAIVLAACPADRPMPPEAAWLEGTEQQQIVRIGRHLRGFDVAMVETGHRYVELYWAGEDENWAYASYQTAKIRTAIANGIERRPKRAASAQMIMPVLDSLGAAAAAGDRDAFRETFEGLTATCNACHAAEQVAYMHVEPPRHRLSPVTRAPEPVGDAGP